MSKIRFIHAADLHLDSPFKGMTGLPSNDFRKLRESTFNAFNNMIQYALKTKPDFVLLVGDIYDGENRSLRAQMKFQEGMQQLHSAQIPVFISYGNHDHLGGRWTRFDLPPNVHVFSEVEKKEIVVQNQQVSIYGFSYFERHVREAMIKKYPTAENDGGFHIGMLHGSIAGDESHAVYAPFTKDDLLSKHYDYWALGHIHLRQQIHENPPIVYPGNIQGRHRNERGLKGFYDVELSKNGSTLEFISTSDIVFEKITVSCEGIRHANEWLQACQEAIDSFKTEYEQGIIELIMNDIDGGAAELFSQSSEEEWLNVLREDVGNGDSFIWIQKTAFEQPKELTAAAGALSQTVLNRMDEWDENEWKDIFKDLYQHRLGMKFLEVLTDDEIFEVKKEAEKLLIHEMSESK